MNREAALVVFSGGQDSTTCLFWAKRNFKKVYALSFLYGQKHQKEVELAREIARKAEVEFDVMDVSFIGKLGRNSLTDATMVMDQENRQIALPIHLFRDVTCFPEHRSSICPRAWHQSLGNGSFPNRFQWLSRLPRRVCQVTQCDIELGYG